MSDWQTCVAIGPASWTGEGKVHYIPPYASFLPDLESLNENNVLDLIKDRYNKSVN